ncbi:hypothetical protein CCUS01_12699 [Colletotrichum cuscutae]|uniref:Uncharacterized protein n=1 Tax=Colletotrichum cuscutae TaxID=1209917 RepID=A0AAI9XDY7_9PEZI|nr:hypothetical protein CCUS01_12699 [Colletotrichum cuscutae]
MYKQHKQQKPSEEGEFPPASSSGAEPPPDAAPEDTAKSDSNWIANRLMPVIGQFLPSFPPESRFPPPLGPSSIHPLPTMPFTLAVVGQVAFDFLLQSPPQTHQRPTARGALLSLKHLP